MLWMLMADACAVPCRRCAAAASPSCLFPREDAENTIKLVLLMLFNLTFRFFLSLPACR